MEFVEGSKKREFDLNDIERYKIRKLDYLTNWNLKLKILVHF